MGILEVLYRVVMRRTPVYVTFVIAGAFFGERLLRRAPCGLWSKKALGEQQHWEAI